MKKMVSFISALAMCVVMAAPMVSSAEEPDEEIPSQTEPTITAITEKTETKEASITVEYKPTEAYIIEIPDSVTIGQPINVNASGTCLEDGSYVTISADTDGKLTYTVTENEQETEKDSIDFTVGLASDKENNVLVSSGSENGNTTFNVALKGDKKPVYAEKYTGTVTFEVKVGDETTIEENENYIDPSKESDDDQPNETSEPEQE